MPCRKGWTSRPYGVTWTRSNPETSSGGGGAEPPQAAVGDVCAGHGCWCWCCCLCCCCCCGCCCGCCCRCCCSCEQGCCIGGPGSIPCGPLGRTPVGLPANAWGA